MSNGPETTYLFTRAEGFYPVHIPRSTLADNIKLNPGTLKVEEYRRNGKHKIVWTWAEGWLDAECRGAQEVRL